jgi:AP-3 complex subunit delta
MVLKNANGSGDPLIQLLPNVFRKDLKGMGDPLTVSISLNCLSRVCSEELASMLYKELLPLYTATKTLIRRKVCIVTYKMFLHYPDGIPELLPYLSDRLKDSKTGVQISAVTSIHEISRLNPRLFLVTIPSLFELFSHTKSNWLIIKLIKLVSSELGVNYIVYGVSTGGASVVWEDEAQVPWANNRSKGEECGVWID